ncbi:MAG: endonuclease/exonuclease/phosphatase family protein [Clostridium sp.]
MKVVTWNCNMAFRKKSNILIERYNPDIILIQECEHGDKLNNLQEKYNILWLGDNKNKGIAVLIKKQYNFETINVDIETIRYVLGVKVGDLKVINIWAMNDKNDIKQRYIGQVWRMLQEYKDNFDTNTIIAGDFNWNVIWDRTSKTSLYGTLSDVIGDLKKLKIESLYHNINNEEFGEEKGATFFMYRKEEKKYHTDYIFASHNIINSVIEFKVGKYDEWKEFSDHMPLFFDFLI